MIIEYSEVGRATLPHGGFRITGRFQDTEPGGSFDVTKRFYVNANAPTEEMVAEKVDYLIDVAYFYANPLNSFNLGVGNEQPVVNSAVTYTRANPTTTIAALTTAVDVANPNMLWKANKFLTMMHQYLEAEMLRTYTFAEFKQFMIDEKFEGLD